MFINVLEYYVTIIIPWKSIENNCMHICYITTWLNSVNGLVVHTNIKSKSSISNLNENLDFN